MATVSATISSVSGWVGDIAKLGVGLIGLSLILDILFPGTTGIVGSVSGLVGSFTSGGLTGLITLLVFLAILRD